MSTPIVTHGPTLSADLDQLLVQGVQVLLQLPLLLLHVLQVLSQGLDLGLVLERTTRTLVGDNARSTVQHRGFPHLFCTVSTF